MMEGFLRTQVNNKASSNLEFYTRSQLSEQNTNTHTHTTYKIRIIIIGAVEVT